MTIKVTIFNKTSAPIYDLRVNFLYGERQAKRLVAGGVAFTEIQSGGDAGIFFSYRDSGESSRKAEPLYYGSSGNRGFLKVHSNAEGVRLINGIYWGDQIPILGIRRVRPTGENNTQVVFI